MTTPDYEYDTVDIPETGGHPFFSNGVNPLIQESIARRLSAGTYVRRSLREVEHFARQGHHLALTATLSDANSFLYYLETSDDIHLEASDIIYPEEPYEGDEQEEFTIDRSYAVLRQARAKLEEATRMHSNSIVEIPDEETTDTAFPATTSAMLAYSAALTFHLEAMQNAQEDILAAEGHNLASQATAFTINYLHDFLARLQKHQRPQSVSRSLLRRATSAANAALQQFQDAGPDRTRFTPLETHPSLWNAPDLLEQARNTASGLLSSSQHDFMIDRPNDQSEIENHLIIMRRNNAVYVKRVTDEYPDDVPWHTAAQHADALMDFAETHDDYEDTQALMQAGQQLAMLAIMELHSVHPDTFQKVLAILAQVCDNPNTFHRAADIIFSHADPLKEHYDPLKDHYIKQQPGLVPAPGTPEQTHAVLQAAIDAGLQPGPLRELCRFLQKDPQDYGISAKEVTWPQVIGLLEETLDINPDRYALENLLTAIGYNPESQEAAQWLDMNAPEDDEDDYDYDTDEDD